MRFGTLAEWLAWQESLHPQAIELGLGRVSRVLERMVLPTRQPFTISVSGTNGKGSCVAMLDSILRAAGYRVGAYTSPHILRYNERIAIDGRPVEDQRIVAAFDRVNHARGDTSLSFFEFGTLAALDIFSTAGLDVRILEVGLGGRLDAVNSVDADLALIASIDIDHREWLGETREAIGHEKAGIMRQGRPAVIADPAPPDSVIRFAAQLGAPLYRPGVDFGQIRSDQCWDWWGGGLRWTALPEPAIPGEHQFLNAAAVLEALQLAAPALPVTEAAIRQGLTDVRLPGRFQYLPGAVPALLDVAHNPQAARMLADHLRRRYPGKRIHAVFSVMRDKDIPGMIEPLRDSIDSWHLAPLSMARAATPEELSGMLHAAGVTRIRLGYGDVRETCAAAEREAAVGDLLLVFGSFFLVSDYLALVARGGSDNG
jgi:dihydrofolate synthase/folylpolyglutamate synthase